MARLSLSPNPSLPDYSRASLHSVVEFDAPPMAGPPRLSILPNPITGGQPTIGQIILDRPAPPGDTIVTLTSSDPASVA
jgi:hypothetical protein